ncbi:Ion_channel domain-containing protein [Hexamita inflata]|uniref:Ion channel domain-containing protein n=1 Tax=Hexamita inflata TaxID=28002 RepID=A0AA86PY19_9EUKA|nr:Ion channel domain-containing protein [Hexamita inflata]
MLNQFVRKQLTPFQFESWLRSTQNKSAFEKLALVSVHGVDRSSFKQFLEFLIKQQNGIFSIQFKPNIRNRFVCQNCELVFSEHVVVKPCMHLYCKQCAQQLAESEFCNICQKRIEDAFVNKQIREEQMNALCTCPYSEYKTAEYQEMYDENITSQNIQDIKDKYAKLNEETLKIAEQFNSGMYVNAVNGMRQHLIQPGYLQQLQPDIKNILKCKQETIQLKHYFYKSIPIGMAPCQYSGTYAQILAHLKNCSQHRIKCSTCGQKGARKTILKHEEYCMSSLTRCPVCFKMFKFDYITDHICECLNQLQSCKKGKYVDIKLEYSVSVLQNSVDQLSLLLKRFIIRSQYEMIHDYEVLSKQAPLTGWFPLLLEKVYKKKALNCSLWFQVLSLALFDVISQCFQSRRSISIILIAFSLLNVVLMSIQLKQQLKTGLYTPDMFTHMFKVYLSVTINFAGLFTFIQLCTNNSFEGIRTSSPYTTFVDLLYFSAVTNARCGFGDVRANSLLCKLLIQFMILFSTVPLSIFFRGSTFFIKLGTIEGSVKTVRKQLEETELLQETVINYTD